MLIINVIERKFVGTSYSRNLRIRNKLPAVIYGCKKKNINIILDHDLIFNLHLKDQFKKQNLILVINKIKHYVKVKSIHYHVFKPKLLHIDFVWVN